MATARRVFGTAQFADGRVLVVGGRDDAGALLNSAESYSVPDGTWLPADSLPVAAVGVVLTP
jgi:hypothetical protein